MIAFEMAVQKGRGCFLNTIVVIIHKVQEDVAIVIILIVFVQCSPLRFNLSQESSKFTCYAFAVSDLLVMLIFFITMYITCESIMNTICTFAYTVCYFKLI